MARVEAYCHHCGSEELETVEGNDGDRTFYHAECGGCAARGPEAATPAEALDKWRKDDKSKVKIITDEGAEAALTAFARFIHSRQQDQDRREEIRRRSRDTMQYFRALLARDDYRLFSQFYDDVRYLGYTNETAAIAEEFYYYLANYNLNPEKYR